MVIYGIILIVVGIASLWFAKYCWEASTQPRLDKSKYTHRASLYGIPCYYKSEGDDCHLAGTNVFFDWMLQDVVPLAASVVNTILWYHDPDHEAGWPIKLKGPIER